MPKSKSFAPDGATIVKCKGCKGKGGFRISGPCFSCDYAAHPKGDSCGWRQCMACGGKGKVYQFKVTMTRRIDG